MKRNVKVIGQRELEMTVDERVWELKNQLFQIHKIHYYKVYGILNEILKLRKTQIKDYQELNLTKEIGIPYNREQIRYIFGMQYLTDKTKWLIDTDKLDAKLFLGAIRRASVLRQATKQDKFFEEVADKKLKMHDVIMMSQNYIERVGQGEDVPEATGSINKMTGRLTYMRKKVAEYRNDLLEDTDINSAFLIEFDRLRNEIEPIRIAKEKGLKRI